MEKTLDYEVRVEEYLPGVVQTADKYLRRVEAERN